MGGGGEGKLSEDEPWMGERNQIGKQKLWSFFFSSELFQPICCCELNVSEPSEGRVYWER